MAKVNGREDALLNAYLNRYQTAQASNVSTGRSTTRKAQQQGSAIMNATDKTLPVLHNSYTETLNNIVQGANLENSLNNDILNRQMKLAKAKFDAANDLYQQQQKAQQYAAKKAAKAAKSSGKSSGKGGSTTGTGSGTESAASLDSLFGGGASTSGTTGNTAGSKPKADDTEKPKTESEKAKEKSAQEKYLEAKKAGARTTAAKSYAERNGTGLVSAAQPAKSRAVTRGGKVIGSSYAAAGSAPSASEAQAAKDKRNDYKSRQEDIATALKKLQSDADYRAELAAPGRKLTSAEVAAVKQYDQNAGDLYKQVQNGTLSLDDYNTQAQALSRMNQKASLNGLGQDLQAATAGFMRSFPMQKQTEKAFTDWADKQTGGKYTQAIESGTVPALVPTLDKYTEQNPLAAMGGSIAGKAVQYNAFNQLVDGTKYADAAQKAGGKLYDAAKKIPVLQNIVQPGFGEAAGRVLADTGADLALDTLPTLADDLSTYSAQQEAIANGQTVDDALTPGKIAGNTAKNIAWNVAMNALPEIGGALFNRLKGTAGDAAQDALKQADDAVQDVQSAAPARNIVQPEANGTTGFAAQIQQMNTPDAANRSALNTLDELRGQVNLNGAQEKEAEQLRRAVLQRQQEIGDEAKLALQNTDSLPIDAPRAAGYNEVNGGVQNDNLGAGVRADVSLNADTGAGYEPQPGGVGSGLAGQTGTAGLGSTADGNGRGVQGPDAPGAGAVAEWAKSITGKDRRSVYTRRIEDLYGQLQRGATRESMADEAKDIATGIVKESSFAEPVDEATATLRDYFKSTPIRLDEQAAGDILYTSGLKNIQQYNFQNGTNFSTTSGLPYDTALMELADMGTGVSGSDVDDLLSAVAASNRGALVDTDQAAATADYYRDMILDGPTGRQAGTEDFADWLEVQGFDSNMPDYTRRVYDRMFGGTDTTDASASLQDSRTQSVAARPLNGSESVPANAVGAESTQYNRNEVLNQDYANQRVIRGDMDEQTAAGIGIGEQTHTVYSRAEGRDTASQDFDVLVQQTGSVTGAGRTVADELNRKIQNGQWDASDVYAGSHAAEQLRQRLAELPEGSAEADVVKAQIANINRAVSAGQSKAGQALVSGRYAQPDEYSGIRRFEQYTQNSVDRFANTRQGQQLHDVAQEVADTMNGPMDDEFTAFVHSQGVDTGDDVRDQLEYMAEQIQRMGRARNVNINEEQARAAAARLQAGGTVEDIYGAFARQALGIGDLSQEDLDYAVDTFRRISDMPDSRERYDLEMSVYGRMANYMPARGFADRLNNIRYLCMLGNSRTHIRNMMGNVMMGTVTRAKDNIAGVMQLALPQNERTKAVGTMLTADGRRMVNRARDYADNQMYSMLYQDGRWNMDTGLQAARNAYATPVGRAIGRLSDINGGALEAEDNFFLRSAFGNSMASFLKARGYDSSIFDATDEHSRSVLRQAAAQALEDAREATFHEDNFLSTAFRNFSNDTRRHGPAGQIAYAVTEGILPFKKTPINIAKNALEYNPVGGAVEAIYRGATGQGATRVMDAAAKGVTGTAILGAGYLLAKNGMLTGGASGDDRADNYNEMLGDQNYAVKIPGKGTYTLDWASPSSVPLLIGAQIAKDQEDGGEFNLTQTLDRMRQITQPVLETTMLQGLNDTLDSVSYADSNDKLATLATSALGSFANQFVPTALGQVARTVDDTRRSSYGGGDTKTERDIGYNIRKMENKIPGLSMNNEPYIDQWGREEASLDGTDDSAKGIAKRAIYNLGSPGYISSENITPVDEYLQGLYGSTNDSHVLPEKASSQITIDSKKYYMTPEEKTEYAKTSGQTAYDLVDELRQNSMFLQLPEDHQSALVQDAYKVAKTAGGVAAVGDGVSGVNAKEYEAYRNGGAEGFSQYVLMKNATDLVRDEKRETSGNDDATLNTVEKWNTLYSQFGDDAVSNFVDSTDDGSTVHNIKDLAGDKAVTAYMQAYSAVAKTLDDGQTPDKFTVGYGMQRYGLSGDDFARAYLAAYYKKDKNGKYPEKGGTYADKAGAEIYQSYGADALRDWVNYRATIPDTNGNGKVDKGEAVARLNEMDLTNEMRRAYLAKTNKQWGKKNPF
nr:MAG TPA: hypothetical protein [Caudoviricetes sp.]